MQRLDRCTPTISRILAGCIATAGICASTGAYADVYEWAPTNGTNWSTVENWYNVTTGAAATVAPGAADTANISGALANQTVVYDAAGSLGILGITQTNLFTNMLDVQADVSIANAMTLGASNGGTSSIRINPQSTSANTTIHLTPAGGITLNSGGLLEMSHYKSGGFTGNSQITGNVTISGGALNCDAAVSTSTGDVISSTLSGNLSMSSGTITIGAAPSSTSKAGQLLAGGGYVMSGNSRLYVTGNLSITGGALVNGGSGGNLFLQGSTNTISGVSQTTLNGIAINIFAAGSSFLCDPIVDSNLTLRSNGATGAGNYTNYIFTLGSASGTMMQVGRSGAPATINLSPTYDGGVTVKLASNITQYFNSYAFTPSASNGGVGHANGIGVDLNGYTLDLTNSANSSGFSTQSGLYDWRISSSRSGGVLKALYFNLSPNGGLAGAAGFGAGTTIDPNVTLIATGGNNTANNLGNANGGVFNAGATFIYAGNATTASAATLSSSYANHTIGNLKVQSGALKLTSAITTGTTSTVQIDSGATLNLGGQTLTTNTLTNNGTLIGTGTIDTGASGIITSNGRLSVGGDGSIGTLSLLGTGTLALTGTTAFDFGSSTYDTVTGTGTITYGGALELNFAAAPVLDSTYTLFSGFSNRSGLVSITSNLDTSIYALNFDPGTGVLSVTSAVPEPATLTLFAIAGAGLLFRRR